MAKTEININLDAKCSQCGAKGATDSGLCMGCIGKKITEGGKMAGGIRIEIKHIAGMNLKFKEGEGTNVVLSMETYLSPGDIARLYNLSKQGVPVRAIIESPQAEFDLVFSEVNTFSGEIKQKLEAVAVE